MEIEQPQESLMTLKICRGKRHFEEAGMSKEKMYSRKCYPFIQFI